MLDDHADDARKGRPVNARAGTNKNRRQRTPTVVALISEGFSSETDPAGIGEQRKTPPDLSKLRRGMWTGRMSRIRIVASALGPA